MFVVTIKYEKGGHKQFVYNNGLYICNLNKMKKIMIILLFTFYAGMSYSIQYTKSDSMKVVALLNSARKTKIQGQQNCIMFFARKFYGVPYVAKTLEINNKERLVVNLHQLDCTTYVENVVALALCVKNKKYSFEDFCNYLRLIRYEKGVNITYPARLHYFTKWIESNSSAGICKEVQSPNPPFSSIQNVYVDYMTKHANLYPMLKDNYAFKEEIRKMERRISGRSYRFIPKSKILNTKLLRQTVHNGDIIVILTNKRGLDTQHLGFASWHTDGLHLINASMIHHKVVEEPKLLFDYLKEHKSMTGIRVVRLTD